MRLNNGFYTLERPSVKNKSTMPYSIKWNDNSAHIVYTGDINNEEIQLAHYEVNNDERFFDCPNLILDITQCKMKNVEVSKLIPVAGLDLGNLKLKERLKITMLANHSENQEKAQKYIQLFKKHTSKIKLFNSMEDAIPWLNSKP